MRLAFAILGFIAMSAASASASWNINRIDTNDFMRPNGTIALDVLGRPHIAYVDAFNNLMYASKTGATWKIQKLWTNCITATFSSISINIDTNSRPHIVFGGIMRSPTIYGVFHAYSLSGTNWSYEVIDAMGDGWNMDSTYDRTGNLHASYYRSGGLFYVVKSGGAWSSPSIITNGGGPTAIAVDSQQKVHLAFCSGNNYGLWYATKAAAQWSFSKIDTNLVSSYSATSMALDTNGIPHITSCVDVSGSGTGIRYFTKSGTNWLKETIAVGLGAANEIDVKPNGTPVVAFADNGPFYEQLLIVERISGTWQTQRVNMATATNSISVNDLNMTLDKSKNPHIVYTTDEYSKDAIYYAGQTGDRDSDQLIDWDEAYTHGTDPDDSDSDDDGLNDYYEVVTRPCLDPLNADTDGDSIEDGQEVANGTDPCCVNPPTNILASDGTYTSKIQVSWSSAGGATGYEVWRFTNSNSSLATPIAHGLASSPYDDTNVTVGLVYFYWLKATNASGASALSSSNSGYAQVAVPSLVGTISYGGSQTGLIHVVANSSLELSNSVLSLDGIDDSAFIETPTASLQLGSQMTICSWINITGTISGTAATIVNKQQTPTRLSYQHSIRKSDNKPYFNSGDERRFLGSHIITSASGWTHLAFTHDGTVGIWYVNGQFSSLTTNPPIDRYGTGSFYIGALFPGQLDDIGLWTRTLSQGEIQGVMSNGLTEVESKLAGFWDFNDGVATDHSTNVNNGVFLNGATTVIGRVRTVFYEYSTNVTSPGGYEIFDLPNGEYTVRAYRDSSGNGSNDSWEACGSYPANPLVITGAMQNIDIVLHDPITDSDGDGLADYDEVYLHGTSWSNRDSDADGMLDGNEIIAGSSPTNPASIWGVAMPTYGGTWHTNVVWDDGAWVTQTLLHAEQCILDWQTLTGRTYRLYGTTNLSGPWATNSPPIAGTGSNISFTTENIDPLKWFFRLGVELDP